MKFDKLECIVLAHDVVKHGLRAGDLGTGGRNLPGGRTAVICNHPSAEDAAKAIASIPMGAFMNFEVYVLADFNETMKASVESLKRAEQSVPK